jgi:hypothetical protein
MPLNKDWREFLELLNSNEVEYLVIGAFAVAFHGFPRYTADLDLLIRPTEENADRVLRALSEFGFGKMGIQAAVLRSPGMVVQLGVKPNRIDLLTTTSRKPGRHAAKRSWKGSRRTLSAGRTCSATRSRPAAPKTLAMRKSCENEVPVRSGHKRIDHPHPAQDGSGMKVLGVEHRRTRLRVTATKYS